jgi:thiamine-monophosphate kinase
VVTRLRQLLVLLFQLLLLGGVDAKNVVYRDGAKPNDLLVITGDIGYTALYGITSLERERKFFKIESM